MAFSFIPDELLANQIAIDSVVTFGLKNPQILKRILIKNEYPTPQLLFEIKLQILKNLFQIGSKRENHLPNIGDENSLKFFDLEAKQRALLQLKYKSNLELSNIEFVTGLKNYEILNSLELAREKLGVNKKIRLSKCTHFKNILAIVLKDKPKSESLLFHLNTCGECSNSYGKALQIEEDFKNKLPFFKASVDLFETFENEMSEYLKKFTKSNKVKSSNFIKKVFKSFKEKLLIYS